MKIVVAPQSYKGSLTALEVARAMERGIRAASPQAEVVLVPLADGGEGTAQALLDATGGRPMTTRVTGPLGKPVRARWGILGGGVTAVIEMAAASGLTLVPPEKRNPLVTTTYGTGELIRAAVTAGCRKLIIGIGGSATNDGGAGMAQALGVRLLNAQGKELSWGGWALARLDRIDINGLEPRLEGCEMVVACDVTNPLCGPLGASAVYGPQKGATPEMVARLEAALSHYADVVARDLGIDMRTLPGGGAAGGLGAGLMAFLKATLRPGIDIVCETVRLTEHLKDADLVLTGEGRLDGQTAFGKTVWGVARRAKAVDLPVIAIAGEIALDDRALSELGLAAARGLVFGSISREQAMADAKFLITEATAGALRLFLLGRK